MNFINFEKRIDPSKGKYFYSPSQGKSEVVSVSEAPKAAEPKSSSRNDSRTPTKANAGGMRVARKRKGSASNVYKKVSDVSGGAYKGMVERRGKLGAKASRALKGAVGAIKANKGKAGMALAGLAATAGLGVAGMKVLNARKKKSNSLQGRLSKVMKKMGR